MASSFGLNGLMSGGSGTASVGDTGASGMDAGSGNFNTQLDLSNLQSISGHTIVDGFTASDVGSLLNLTQSNTANSITSALGTTMQEVTSSASGAVSSFFSSSGFKWAMLGIGALIAFLIFRK